MPGKWQILAGIGLLWAGGAWAAQPAAPTPPLTAEHVVVLAVEKSADSRRVAEHYAKARGIPAEHVLYLDLPVTRDLPRADFEQLRKKLREKLTAIGMADKVRCLVTVYDVPVRVQARPNSPEDDARAGYLDKRIAARIGEIAAAAGEMAKLGGRAASAAAPDKLPEALAAFAAAARETGNALNNTPDSPERKLAIQQFEKLRTTVGGFADSYNSLRGKLNSAGGLSEQEKLNLAYLTGEIRGLESGVRALEGLPDSEPRNAAVEQLMIRHSGLSGLVNRYAAERDRLSPKEAHAALDSELSLLFWDEYPVNKWVFSPLHHMWEDPRLAPQKPRGARTLMVARLEGVTVDVTLRMIDAAVEVEKTGLDGKAYFDARGMAAEPAGSGKYGEYDEAVRAAAAFLKQKTTLDVMLDNTGELFGPGSCPKAALYCGWYSVGNYVPALTPVRGAVGYHIASFEAVDLRDPNTKQWCKNLLESGFAVTVGPVAEPYLFAFPKPDEFFPLLLTGQYTVAECYWRTQSSVSWMCILLGDPLYNPFKAKPMLKKADLPARLVIPANWGQ